MDVEILTEIFRNGRVAEEPMFGSYNRQGGTTARHREGAANNLEGRKLNTVIKTAQVMGKRIILQWISRISASVNVLVEKDEQQSALLNVQRYWFRFGLAGQEVVKWLESCWLRVISAFACIRPGDGTSCHL